MFQTYADEPRREVRFTGGMEISNSAMCITSDLSMALVPWGKSDYILDVYTSSCPLGKQSEKREVLVRISSNQWAEALNAYGKWLLDLVKSSNSPIAITFWGDIAKVGSTQQFDLEVDLDGSRNAAVKIGIVDKDSGRCIVHEFGQWFTPDDLLKIGDTIVEGFTAPASV